MIGPYPETYWRVFRAAMDAAVAAVAALPREEVEALARYTGIVGLAAELVESGGESTDAGRATGTS